MIPARPSPARPGTGSRYLRWPAGCWALASRPPSRRTWPRAGPTARSERWSRPGQRPASSAPMNSWYGLSEPPGHPDASHQLSSTARVRRAAVRRVPSQLGPLTAGSTAAATPIRALRADDRRISLPGIRLPLSADSKVTGLPGQMPITAQRWPRTGSARKSAIRSPNASSPRCSGAPPAAGHAPGSPKRSDHPYPSNAVTHRQRVGVAGLRRHLRYVTAAATGVRLSLPITGRGLLCRPRGCTQITQFCRCCLAAE